MPPDHTAEFNEANLLSSFLTSFPKYFLNKSGYFFNAVSVSKKITFLSFNSLSILLYNPSDSYCTCTPPKYSSSAFISPMSSKVSLTPFSKLSQLSFISSNTF